jgi:hypothetical protein
MKVMPPIVDQYTYAICEVFEDLLDKHNIDIPDDDRQGSPNEGRIYGATWGDLTDKIYELLEQFKEEARQSA